ncbi:MAG: O-antigen ligase family protein [Caulobacteraceae bacterium]|nr:O-antigen ligase family protein [Caulobacteraceae bacterium]
MPSGRRPPLPAIALAYLAAGIVFAGHLALGAGHTNVTLTLAAIWFAVLAALLASQSWARRAVQEAALGWPAVPFALVLLLAVLSLTPFGVGGPNPIWSFVPGATATATIDPYATLVELIKLMALAAVFLVGVAFGGDDGRAKALIRALLLLGALYCAWAFVDHALSPNLLFGSPRPFGPDRLSASFGSANTAATLFGALTLLNIVDLARTYQSGRRRGSHRDHDILQRAPALARPLLALALSLTCLVLTQSRAGMAATAGVGLALLGALAASRSGPSSPSAPVLGATAVVTGLALGSVALNLGALQQRFLFIGPDTLGRGQIFAAHWSAFQAAPWGGYGLGSFARINAMIMDRSNLVAIGAIGAAHNVYIQWLEEAGGAGAAAMFAVVVVIGLRLIIGAVQRQRMRGWLMGVGAALLLFLLHGATDYALEVFSMALFLSLLLGVGFGAAAPTAPARPAERAPSRVRAGKTVAPA